MTLPTVTTTLLKGSDAPARVLLVGAGLGTGVHALWARCAALLPADTLVIGWDLPGHGESSPHTQATSVAELAEAVVTALGGLTADGQVPAGLPVHYAGVSLNGAVALQLALDHAETLTSSTVVCSAAKIGEPQAWRERAELVEKAGTPTMVVGSAQRWFGAGFIEKHPERTTGLLHTLQNADRHSYARLCEALAEFDVRGRLGELSLPVLTIHGEQDAVTPPSAGEEIAAGAPAGLVRTLALESVAHQAPLEAPESVAQALAEFMAEAERAATEEQK